MLPGVQALERVRFAIPIQHHVVLDLAQCRRGRQVIIAVYGALEIDWVDAIVFHCSGWARSGAIGLVICLLWLLRSSSSCLSLGNSVALGRGCSGCIDYVACCRRSVIIRLGLA